MIEIRELHSLGMVMGWPKVEAVIAPAVALNSGRVSIAEGEVLGALIGYEVKYPSRKSLAVLMIAGRSRQSWQDGMMETVERAARNGGCDLIEGIGRKGFGRVLPGYDVVGFLYEKDLRV
jgi:hypothetical protein